MNEIKHNRVRKTAKPRTGRVLDAVNSVNGISGGGGGSSISTENFVKKKGETSQQIEGAILVGSEVVAYATGEHDIVLPIASKNALGAVKIGDNLTVDENGRISAIKPEGGIGSLNVTGSGNAVTGMTLSADGRTITANKGLTLATAADLSTHASNTTHITSTERTNWNDASNKKHEHSNKSLLDIINQGLSTTSAVNFKSVKAAEEIVAFNTGSSFVPFFYWKPSVSADGVLSWSSTTSETTPSATNIKGPAGDSAAISNVQYFVSTETSTSYNSGLRVRCGFRDLSGTISAGTFVTFIIWEAAPLTSVLSFVANYCMVGGWVGKELVCTVEQDTGNNCYRIVLFNPSSASISLTGHRVNYIAMMRQ